MFDMLGWMAPGRIRLELVRIQREIMRARQLGEEATEVLRRASEDHKRVIRELTTVKNQLLRDELLELANRVQQEGIAARKLRS